MHIHADSIMRVRFVPDTHYFFSVSKDRFLKFCDGDKFEEVLALKGHHAEVWALAVDRSGTRAPRALTRVLRPARGAKQR